jgi:glycine hydroxymethyltransferase
MVLCREQYAKAIDKALFPGSQGGPLMHVIAAKAVCLGEAMQPAFKECQQQVVKNAAAMAQAFDARGVKMVSGGTDNHLLLLDLRDTGVTGKELEHRLDEVRITVNKNTIPNEPLSPFVTSGVRIGTPAVTTRGFGEAEMVDIARWIAECIFDFEASKERIAAEVEALTARFPLYE